MGREYLHAEIEQLDEHAGLADVDADHVAVRRVDLQNRARSATLGVFDTCLDQHILLEQFADDVADSGEADSRRDAELLTGHRPVQIERVQGS